MLLCFGFVEVDKNTSDAAIRELSLCRLPLPVWHASIIISAKSLRREPVDKGPSTVHITDTIHLIPSLDLRSCSENLSSKLYLNLQTRLQAQAQATEVNHDA